MSDHSEIEWTDATWNPVRGCTKVSAGCANCYAETFSERWRDIPGHPYERGFDPRLVPEKVLDPLRWRRPRRVFVNSMSDLFHERVPAGYIDAVLGVMKLADWHTFQVLTKRACRMRSLLERTEIELRDQGNVWLGVSVENREQGLPRIQELVATPCAVRFLSIEPLLEDLGEIDLEGIDWVIVGGESGPRARPMRRSWVVSIRAQCRAQQIPFFFKQWGGVQKKKAGRVLDGRTYDEVPVGRDAEPPSRCKLLERRERAETLLAQVA